MPLCWERYSRRHQNTDRLSHSPGGAEQGLRTQDCSSAAPVGFEAVLPSLVDQVLPLKLLPSSRRPLVTYVLRVLPIDATVSQGSCPGLSALRGQGLHPTLHHGIHGSRAWLALIVQEYVLSRSPDKMRAQGATALLA